jgi:hypothetical protein
MPVSPSHRNVRPYRGRDPKFAEAMARAEDKARPKVEQPLYVARTRRGSLVRNDGRLIQPGPLMDADAFNALPIEE